MPIKAEDVLRTIGVTDLEKYEKPEDFKSEFDGKFIAKDHIQEDEELKSSIFNKLIGPYDTSVRKAFKDAGFEFAPDELKDKKLPDIVRHALETKVKPIMEELTTIKETGNTDEATKKELEKYKKKTEEYKTKFEQFEGLNNSLNQRVEELTTGFENEKKSWIVNQQLGDIFSRVKYKTAGLPESAVAFMKSGFENDIRSNYKFELNDQQKLVILTADGKRVEDPKTSGKVLDPFEVVKLKAVEKQIWEDNPNNGKTSQTYVPPKNKDNNQSGFQPARRMTA